MRHSSFVGILAFALCLVACLVVSAEVEGSQEEEPSEITKDIAQKAVDNAKSSIKAVSGKAEGELSKIKTVLERVEEFKAKVEEAESQAVQALSKAEKAAKENEGANTVVKKLKEISNTLSTSYKNSKEKVGETNVSLGAVLKKAENLKTDCEKEDMVITERTTNFTDIKTKALEIKQKVDDLNSDITAALAIMGEGDSIENDMEKNVKDTQLATFHVIGIVAVTEIQTMMGDTNSITQTTQTKKNEVNDIVQQLKALKTTAKSKSNEDINKLCKAAEYELTTATNAVGKAEEAEKEMTKEKELADSALKNVPQHSDVSKAKKEGDKVEACVEKFKSIVAQLKSELLKAEYSVRKAKALKEQIETALSPTTSELTTEKVKETANSQLPVEQGSQHDKKDTTTQPTSKDLLTQNNNGADILKDALSNGAQNVPTTSLTGGKAPAPGANNDSAMTVSVPLLVALITLTHACFSFSLLLRSTGVFPIPKPLL